jgi:ABC-type polysaccharide/polyol phosphate transport system, ATPase component
MFYKGDFMDKNIAISVMDVSKIYRLYDKPIDRLKEALSLTHKKYHKEFFALDKLSFNVEKGSTVGIIGTNGSGKSTILKIITGVLNPSTGSVKVDGNISALLELGAGFNSDYTGIENIYMNGTMMGFSREEMEKKLPEILEFADIGDFVYQPVKTYSSGMFVRLAFALAINVEPEILIVDEALSVGDVFFQSKCYAKMEEIRKKGTTILMVTHDMGSIIKYCDKVVLLNKGKFLAEGSARDMVDLYKKILAGQFDETSMELSDFNSGVVEDLANIKRSKEDTFMKTTNELMKAKMTINPSLTEYGDGRAGIVDFGIVDAKGSISNLLMKGEYFYIKEKIRFNSKIKSPIFTYTIKDKKGTELSGTNTMLEAAKVEEVDEGDIYEVSFKQKMTLQGGEYLLSMSCTGFEEGDLQVYHRLYDVASITVISNKNTVGIFDMESEVEIKLHRS